MHLGTDAVKNVKTRLQWQHQDRRGRVTSMHFSTALSWGGSSAESLERAVCCSQGTWEAGKIRLPRDQALFVGRRQFCFPHYIKNLTSWLSEKQSFGEFIAKLFFQISKQLWLRTSEHRVTHAPPRPCPSTVTVVSWCPAQRKVF